MPYEILRLCAVDQEYSKKPYVPHCFRYSLTLIPLHLLKHPAEVVHIPNPALLTDLLGRFVGEAKQVFRLGDSDTQQIIPNADPKLLFEHPGQIILIDKVTLGQFVQRCFFCIVFVQIPFDFQQIGFLCACSSFLRIPAVRHQEGQEHRQIGVDIHVTNIGATCGNFVQVVDDIGVSGDGFRVKDRQTAPVDVFLIDICCRGAIEMHP